MKSLVPCHLSLSPAFALIILMVTLSINGCSSLDIQLKPYTTEDGGLPEDHQSFAGFFFQPYKPAPNTPLECKDYCPCSFEPDTTTTCDCDFETKCGSSFLADLSSGTSIVFHWDASSDNTKYISIQGTQRTRVEFQGTVPCDSDGPTVGFVEIQGDAIQFEIDAEGIGNLSQSFVYSPGDSFVSLGKCDGCGACEIYTRLQFDPKDGVLDLKLKSLTFSGDYDSAGVIQGEHEYEWSTLGYCWMRDSRDNRRTLDHSRNEKDATSRRWLNGGNKYELLLLENGPSPTKIPGSSASLTLRVPLLWCCWWITTIIVLFLIFAL